MTTNESQCPKNWWCVGNPGHKDGCFEYLSHRDTCPGAPDCIHETEDEETGSEERDDEK